MERVEDGCEVGGGGCIVFDLPTNDKVDVFADDVALQRKVVVNDVAQMRWCA